RQRVLYPFHPVVVVRIRRKSLGKLRKRPSSLVVVLRLVAGERYIPRAQQPLWGVGQLGIANESDLGNVRALVDDRVRGQQHHPLRPHQIRKSVRNFLPGCGKLKLEMSEVKDVSNAGGAEEWAPIG